MEQFYELSLILLIALVVSVVMRALKQPLVIGYIITGILVGPYFLNILRSVEVVELFSKLGITSLLFIVGLGLSPKVLKELGVVSTVTGIGQVVFTSVFGYLISLALGYTSIQSIYIAIALTFSSTIIILKLLSDKGDLSKLYGRIAIGFLLVQDLVASVMLVGITGMNSLKGSTEVSIFIDLALLMVKGFIILVILFLISTKILSRFSGFIARSQEFLFVFAISWGISIAALYYKVGLSIEIGALVGGISLSMTTYSYEISSRLRPLRDFFITLFFVLLGGQMVFNNLAALIIPTIIFSLFILIGNPLIVIILMNLMGYTKKTGFMAGLTVAQISEFSLILIKLGLDVGHLSENILSMVTLVGIITIAGSTYMILYSDELYKIFHKLLNKLEFRKTKRAIRINHNKYEALIFGYRRAGPEFAHVFNEIGIKFTVIDFNPDTIQKLEALKIPCEYGDASDVEFLQELDISSVKFVVSTVPDFEDNMLLTKTVRRYNPNTVIIVLTDTLEHAMELYDAGVTNVVLSHYIGAKFAADMIRNNTTNMEIYNEARNEDMERLKGLKVVQIY